jgi:hypothetical protein
VLQCLPIIHPTHFDSKSFGRVICVYNLILGCLDVVLIVVINSLAVQSARKCLLRSLTVLILPKVSKHLLEAARVTLASFRRANCILDDATPNLLRTAGRIDEKPTGQGLMERQFTCKLSFPDIRSLLHSTLEKSGSRCVRENQSVQERNDVNCYAYVVQR